MYLSLAQETKPQKQPLIHFCNDTIHLYASRTWLASPSMKCLFIDFITAIQCRAYLHLLVLTPTACQLIGNKERLIMIM